MRVAAVLSKVAGSGAASAWRIYGDGAQHFLGTSKAGKDINLFPVGLNSRPTVHDDTR